MEKLKISVLTPCYNSAKDLERAIKSVLIQDYKNWEHIVVDGGSKDNTLDILKQYEHINWISEQDRGQSDAMNKAFKKSTGDLIVYLNADDEFLPGAFHEINAQFERHKDVDIMVGGLIKKESNGLDVIKRGTDSFYGVFNYNWYVFPLNPVSYFYKRHVQETIGNFPLDNHYTMDYWFLLRAFYAFNVKRIDKVLGIFHFDNQNKSSDAQRGEKMLRKERIRFVLYPFKPKLIYTLLKSKLLKKH